MDTIKLDALDEIAKQMANVIGIGGITTDRYEYNGRIVFVECSTKDSTLSLVDNASGKVLGTVPDPHSRYMRIERITELFTNSLPDVKKLK